MKRTLRWVWLVLVVGALATVGGCKLFNADPIADFDWSPNEPLARTEVEFESTATDDEGGLFGGGGIVSYDWDFDDNDSSTNENPTHEFTKSGEYDVELTVTDDAGGTDSVTKTVEITPSIDGRWRGYIVDPGRIQDDLELEISHSVSGGIQGTAYWGGVSLACSDMSFNPTTKQVRFSLFDLGIRLDGTLDASETRIQGNWYILGAPAQLFTWDVALD